MKGFKTIFAAFLLTFLGALQQADLINFVPEHYRGLFISLVGLFMAGLRLITDSKPFSQE